MLSEEVRNLEKDLEFAHKENDALKVEILNLRKEASGFKKCCMMVIPEKVYTHKERKNTTVKFMDGSQMTVKRKAGEKDCIETAIAYCVLKQLITAEELKKLVKEREEH